MDRAEPRRFVVEIRLQRGSNPVRFVLSVWILMLSALVLFSFVVFTHQFFDPTLSSPPVAGSLVLSTWVIGLASAIAIHILYRRAERAIQQAARDETIVQLAGAVAHELNQPLSVVVSTAELICARDRSAEDMRQMALRMSEASQLMADIVSKLQHATRYQSKSYVGSVRIVDLDKAS